MRIVICLLFALAGLTCTLTFALGFIPAGTVEAVGITEATIDAITDPTFGVGAVVAAVAAFFFLGYALRASWPARESLEEERSWGKVFQLGFSASVALVGAFLLAILLSAGGLLPLPPASGMTLGALSLLAALQAAVGTVLAVVLLLVRGLNVHYVATVAVHVMEVALLSVLFVMGSST